MILLAAQITQAAAQGEPDMLDSALREALPLTAGAGNLGDAGTAVLSAAGCAGYRYGRWDDALAHVGAIGRDGHAAARPGLRPPGPHQGIAALIALRRGDRARADAALADLPAPCPGAPGGPPRPVHRVTEALALRAEADGDLGLAVGLMSAWLSAPAGLGAHERHDDALPSLVRMASEAAQEETARAAAALSRADAAADPSAGRTAAARLCQALVDDDAAGLLDLAAVYEGYGWLPMRAFTLEEASVRLAAAGDLLGARKAVTGAVRGYAALGAAWDIRRADTRLRRHGVRRGSRSIRRGPATGWDALTPAERRIADLAGQGMSNPDIAARLHLSRRTVQNHLTRVLAKLGLSSRLEIVRAATYREQADTALRRRGSQPGASAGGEALTADRS
jgi:DNA-binding CsgD family transcriptional regulator